MRDLTTAFTMGTASFLLLIGAGCSQSPQGGGAEQDTPEFAAMEYRQGLMHVIASKAATLRGMADGSIAVDDTVFAEYSADLAALAGMIIEGFVPGSDSESLPGSNALPAAWDNRADLEDRAATLQSATRNIADLAAAGNYEAARSAAGQDIGAACGGCHRNYRRQDD